MYFTSASQRCVERMTNEPSLSRQPVSALAEQKLQDGPGGGFGVGADIRGKGAAEPQRGETVRDGPGRQPRRPGVLVAGDRSDLLGEAFPSAVASGGHLRVFGVVQLGPEH